MLRKKYYSGISIHKILNEELNDGKIIMRIMQRFAEEPDAQPEIVRCKECKYAPKCYGDVLMRSKGGGYIYCPVEYCSEAERR